MDDTVEVREVSIELDRTARNFIAREARRLNVSRGEVIARAIKMLQVYSQTPASHALDGDIDTTLRR